MGFLRLFCLWGSRVLHAVATNAFCLWLFFSPPFSLACLFAEKNGQSGIPGCTRFCSRYSVNVLKLLQVQSSRPRGGGHGQEAPGKGVGKCIFQSVFSWGTRWDPGVDLLLAPAREIPPALGKSLVLSAGLLCSSHGVGPMPCSASKIL